MDVEGVKSRPGLDSFFFSSKGKDGMQGDICPGCTDMGEAVTYTEAFKPRHR